MLLKSTFLNLTIGEVSLLPFERRIAPCSPDRMKSATSLQSSFPEAHQPSLRPSGKLSASFQECRKNLDEAVPDWLVVPGEFGRVGAVEAAVLYTPLIEECLVGIKVRR